MITSLWRFCFLQLATANCINLYRLKHRRFAISRLSFKRWRRFDRKRNNDININDKQNKEIEKLKTHANYSRQRYIHDESNLELFLHHSHQNNNDHCQFTKTFANLWTSKQKIVKSYFFIVKSINNFIFEIFFVSKRSYSTFIAKFSFEKSEFEKNVVDTWNIIMLHDLTIRFWFSRAITIVVIKFATYFTSFDKKCLKICYENACWLDRELSDWKRRLHDFDFICRTVHVISFNVFRKNNFDISFRFFALLRCIIFFHRFCAFFFVCFLNVLMQHFLRFDVEKSTIHWFRSISTSRFDLISFWMQFDSNWQLQLDSSWQLQLDSNWQLQLDSSWQSW